MKKLTLRLLPDRLAVVQFDSAAGLPANLVAELFRLPFFSLTRTSDEWSLVVEESIAATVAAHQMKPGWRAFQVVGPLDFSLVGILADLSSALAAAGISLFAISTYDTDIILVRSVDMARATAAWEVQGHRVEISSTRKAPHDRGDPTL